jgi:hypothetical protein
VKKPWPRWLFGVEVAAYTIWKPLIGAAFGVGIAGMSGWERWFMVVVAVAWIVDNMLMIARRSSEGPPSVTLEGALKLDGGDARQLMGIIQRASKEKGSPEGLN